MTNLAVGRRSACPGDRACTSRRLLSQPKGCGVSEEPRAADAADPTAPEGVTREVPPWLHRALSALAGACVALALFSSASDMLDAVPFLAVGLAIGVWLWRSRRLAGLLAFLGFLIGFDLAVIGLMIDPPCRSIEDLVVTVRNGVPEVLCRQLDDVTEPSVAALIGSVAIGGLVLALYKLRKLRDRPEPVAG